MATGNHGGGDLASILKKDRLFKLQIGTKQNQHGQAVHQAKKNLDQIHRDVMLCALVILAIFGLALVFVPIHVTLILVITITTFIIFVHILYYASVKGKDQYEPLLNVSMPEAVLAAVSATFADVFARERRMWPLRLFLTGHYGERIHVRRSCIRLPEDEEDTWLVLLYWLRHHTLPTDESIVDDLHFAIRCWTLGHAYRIPLFQDAVMLAMLQFFEERKDQSLSEEMIREAFFGSEPGSPLQRLIAEQIILQDNDDSHPYLDLDGLLEPLDEEGSGFYAAYLPMKRDFDCDNMAWSGYVGKFGARTGRGKFREYLLKPQDTSGASHLRPPG